MKITLKQFKNLVREAVIDASDRFLQRDLDARVAKLMASANSPEARRRMAAAQAEDDELERITGCRFGDALNCHALDCKHAPYTNYDPRIVNASDRFKRGRK